MIQYAHIYMLTIILIIMPA